MKLSTYVTSPTSILTWQWVMESCGDEWKIENGASKAKDYIEDKNTLVNILYHLFWSFIANDDGNTALCHLAIKMKTLHCIILLSI